MRYRSRGSATALKAARLVVYADSNPSWQPLLSKEIRKTQIELLCSLGLLSSRTQNLLASRALQYAVATLDRFTLDRQLVYFLLRKRFLDDETRRIVAEGIEQLVILGAGYDSLGLRIARSHPNLPCFEIDHPATTSFKQQQTQHSSLLPPNLSLHPADLSQTDGCEPCPWDPQKSTLFVAEGLLMYLTEPQVEHLLTTLKASSAKQSRFLGTVLKCTPRGRPAYGPIGGFARMCFRLLGEPLQSCSAPDIWHSRYTQLGFKPIPDLQTDLKSRYLTTPVWADQPPARLEFVTGLSW